MRRQFDWLVIGSWVGIGIAGWALVAGIVWFLWWAIPT